MRAATILLALVAVLGFVSEAGAVLVHRTNHSYIISIGEQRIGFADGTWSGWGSQGDWSRIHLGPLGERGVPFTATQGLIGFCLMLAMMVIVPVVLTVRWRKKSVQR